MTEDGGARAPCTRSTCIRSTSASTPARPSSPRRPPTCTRPTRRGLFGETVSRARRLRGAPVGRAEDHHPRRRPQPHRPGHRVRLLLLPCLLRAHRGGLRDHHDQLQPGDGVDRLRHLGPALLRAADRRGRAGDRSQGAVEGHAEGRHRAVRRPDAAEARRTRWKTPASRSSAPRPTPSISPRTATASRS